MIYVMIVFLLLQEQDSQFRYIALELCVATLQDYIEGKKFERNGLDAHTILNQAMSGIAYLHSLDIGNEIPNDPCI